MSRWKMKTFSAIWAVILVVQSNSSPSAHGITERVSVGPAGVEADSYSFFPTISKDGRFIAFASYASNLIPGDTLDSLDVFVRDRATSTTERVSGGLGGVQANGFSSQPSISEDGRFVAFDSDATNLVAGDACRGGIFVRDRAKGITECVSHGLGGAQANRGGYQPSISAGGRFVAFTSSASNLVPGDTNGYSDAFVYDRQSRIMERVSLGKGDVQADADVSARVSASGRYVTLVSAANNLVPNDTNGQLDMFLRDRRTGTIRRVSVGPGGVQGNGYSSGSAISTGGRFIAFTSTSTNLVQGDTNGSDDVFIRDRWLGLVGRVSLGQSLVQADEGGFGPAISADGRFVAFTSSSTNLVRADTNQSWDVFVHDREAGTTRRVSLGPGDKQGNGYSEDPDISADGRVVAFVSAATNLVPNDTNDQGDIFVRVLAP